MTDSRRDELISTCIREAGICAVVISTSKDGTRRLLVKRLASISQSAHRRRKVRGVKHFRLWLRDCLDARRVFDVVKTMKDHSERTAVDVATELRLIWHSDNAVYEQAGRAVDHALDLVDIRLERGIIGSRSRKTEQFASLRTLIKQLFYKPLFPDEN